MQTSRPFRARADGLPAVGTLCIRCLQVTLGPGAYSIEETAYWSERVYRWDPVCVKN